MRKAVAALLVTLAVVSSRVHAQNGGRGARVSVLRAMVEYSANAADSVHFSRCSANRVFGAGAADGALPSEARSYRWADASGAACPTAENFDDRTPRRVIESVTTGKAGYVVAVALVNGEISIRETYYVANGARTFVQRREQQPFMRAGAAPPRRPPARP